MCPNMALLCGRGYVRESDGWEEIILMLLVIQMLYHINVPQLHSAFCKSCLACSGQLSLSRNAYYSCILAMQPHRKRLSTQVLAEPNMILL